LVFKKNSRFRVKEEEDKGKKERNKEEKYFFSFYTLRSYYFPSKKKFIQKTEHLFKFDTCQQSKEIAFIDKV